MGLNQSHLYCCLDKHLSKTYLHLYLCCCFWMFHSQTSRQFLCHPACVHQEDCRLSLTSHLARSACKCTIDFHSQVSHLSTCLQVHCDFHSQVSHLSTCLQVHCDFHSQVSHLSTCLQVHCDFHSQVSHLSTCLQVHCDFHSQANHLAAVIVPFGTGLPLWHIYFRGTVILLV